MKLRIYLDTSVLSAYCDERTPERMRETRDFWNRLGEFEVSTSELVREEVQKTPNSNPRSLMLGLLSQTREISVEEEARELAGRYVEHELFNPSMYNDALHLAVAVISRQDILLSWNFKHLVNRRMRARVCEVNAQMSLPMIEILAPSEL